MIRYLFKACVILVLLVGVASVLVHVQKSLLIWNEQNLWQATIDMAEENFNPDQTEGVILGDSRASGALNPAWLRPGVRNLALGGGTALEGYYLLKRLLKHSQPPRVLIISYAPFHLVHMDTFWQRGLKYGLYDIEDLLEISFEFLQSPEQKTWGDANFSFFSGGKLPFALRVIDIGLLYLGFAPYYQADSLLSWSSGEFSYRKTDYELHRKRLGWRPFNSSNKDQLSTEVGLRDFVPSKVIDQYFVRILETARAHHIHVIWANMPMKESTRRLLTPEFVSSFEAYFRTLAKRFPEFEIETKLTFMANSQFADGSHVNPHGARDFTLDFGSRYMLSRE